MNSTERLFRLVGNAVIEATNACAADCLAEDNKAMSAGLPAPDRLPMEVGRAALAALVGEGEGDCGDCLLIDGFDCRLGWNINPRPAHGGPCVPWPGPDCPRRKALAGGKESRDA
jgi:hypothetical protein